MKGSEIVELIDGKIRKKDNPKMWPLPPNSPLTGKHLFYMVSSNSENNWISHLL